MKLNLFTDASGALGFGAVFGPHWFFFQFFYYFVFSLVLWKVATRLGTQEYRHPGILSHCSIAGPVG